MTTKELELLAGVTVEKGYELVLTRDGRLFHRDVDGWREYPPYPVTADRCS